MLFNILATAKTKDHCLPSATPTGWRWGQWPSSAGTLLWRAALILCGDEEVSSSVSDPEGSWSPSWDPVSPTSSRRNLNFDRKRCHTKYQPHTISSSTISSVATTTSSVSPTLCHILGAEGRPARGGGAGGARGRRAGPGLQRRRGGMGGGRPQGAGRGGAGTHRGRRANPADPPSRRGGRSAGGGVSRNASTPSSLPGAWDAEPGDPGGGDRMRFHGGHHAPVGGEDRLGDARRSHGPRRRPPEGVLGPNERRITSPGSR